MTRPLCGNCDDGWITDDETGLPVRRCPCRDTPQQAKITALVGVAAAKPAQIAAAVLIIKDVAEQMPALTSNDTRDRMLHAGIDIKGVSGTAFKRAEALGYIKLADGLVPSGDPATRSSVHVWESCRYKGSAA